MCMEYLIWHLTHSMLRKCFIPSLPYSSSPPPSDHLSSAWNRRHTSNFNNRQMEVPMSDHSPWNYPSADMNHLLPNILWWLMLWFLPPINSVALILIKEKCTNIFFKLYMNTYSKEIHSKHFWTAFVLSPGKNRDRLKFASLFGCLWELTANLCNNQSLILFWCFHFLNYLLKVIWLKLEKELAISKPFGSGCYKLSKTKLSNVITNDPSLALLYLIIDLSPTCFILYGNGCSW